MGIILLAFLLLIIGAASTLYAFYQYRRGEDYRISLASGILMLFAGLTLLVWFLSSFG